MLMYVRPENKRSFGQNANKVWYVGPCLKHYCTFRGILPSAVDGQGQNGGYSKNEASYYCNTKANVG